MQNQTIKQMEKQTKKNQKKLTLPSTPNIEINSVSNKAIPPENEKQLQDEKRKNEIQKERIDTLYRVLKFGEFLNCSFEPIVEDVEIVVSFLDVRGFTNYCKKLQQEMQDRKIQNFLKQYNKVFNEGLMNWFTKHIDPEYGKVTNDNLLISEYIIPTMYKNLGDGIMMVWEIPSTISNEHEGKLTQNIIFLLDEIIKRFYYHFRKLTGVERDSYSTEVLKLEMGCGAAKGHAWKLNYGNRIDYAGSIINLASRLEGFARPAGIVCQYDTSPWLFNQLVSNDEGKIASIKNIKGYDTKTFVWINSSVDSKAECFIIETIEEDPMSPSASGSNSASAEL